MDKIEEIRAKIGECDDIIIKQLAVRMSHIQEIISYKKATGIPILQPEQEKKQTDALAAKLDAAQTQTEIEDIYRPFRPKRRTRASIAKEKGLQPLADIIWGQKLIGTPEEAAKAFVDSGQGVDTVLDAINGERDMLA